MAKSLLGNHVIYTLTGEDVQMIEQLVPALNGAGGTNYNTVHAGQEYPALVVRLNGGGSVNLKVQLDGGASAVYWATSRKEGDELGQWRKR
ncbi:hypothetical protein AB0425_17375 [Actinosynnema sp. NPDC051121]